MLTAHSGRREDRRGDDERQRGDDDLEGEQRLEAEHRPVAAPVHPERQQREDRGEEDRARHRAAVAARGRGRSARRRSPRRASSAQTAIATSSAAGARPGRAARARRGPLARPSAPMRSRVKLGRLRARGRGVEQRSRSSARPRAPGPRRRRSPAARTRALGARLEHLGEVARVQAADREERHRRVRGRVADQLEADGRAARLGRRLVHRARRRCSRRAPESTASISAGAWVESPISMSRPDELAHLDHRHVVLADVDAVGAGLDGDAGAVVDDQQQPRAARRARARRARPRRARRRRGCLSRSWTMSTPPAAAPRSRSGSVVRPVAPSRTRGTGALPPAAARRSAPRSSLGIARKSRRRRCRPSRPAGASISRMPSDQRADVLVVGGGIIGLAVAWRARRRGMSVTLLERDALRRRRPRASPPGMLAPVAEVEFGAAGRRVLELGLRSAALWPAFAAELAGRGRGSEVALRRPARCCVARDEDEARELERQLEFRRSLGLRVRAPARRARPASSSRRSRRRCAWRWRRPTTTPSIRGSCSRRCAPPARRRACGCASTRRSRASSWTAPAGA